MMSENEKAIVRTILLLNEIRIMLVELEDIGECYQVDYPPRLMFKATTWEGSRELLRKIGDRLGDHNWRLDSVWNSGILMLSSYKFKNYPVEVWLQTLANEFPVEKVSPGCRIEKTVEERETFNLVCPR